MSPATSWVYVTVPGKDSYATVELESLGESAIVNVPKLPYWFLDTLKELNIEPIYVWPTEEKAVNCLAVRPGKVIIASGCPRTVERLNMADVVTVEIPYDEIHKNGGGIHCSTLPLVRERG